MKKITLGLIVTAKLSLMGVAYAGSMGSNEVINWTGIYFGANGGGGFGDPSVAMTYLQSGQLERGITWYPTKVSQKFSGAIFGGQLGYNYQLMPQMVLGLKYDTDLSQWTAYNKRASGDSTGSTAILYSAQKLNWFAHLLPRLGYLIKDNLLFYGTGGLVFGNVQGTANQAFSHSLQGINSYPGSFKINTTGWSAGAGFEWKIAQNWSLGIEYLYNDLGNNSVIANETFPTGSVSSFYQNQYRFNTNFQTVALAVNYHW